MGLRSHEGGSFLAPASDVLVRPVLLHDRTHTRPRQDVLRKQCLGQRIQTGSVPLDQRFGLQVRSMTHYFHTMSNNVNCRRQTDEMLASPPPTTPRATLRSLSEIKQW